MTQELKMVIESLANTIDQTGLRVSDETIFIQACTFLRTPGQVGHTESSTGNKGVKRMASKAQIAYFHQHGLGDTENLTAKEAFKKIRDHKENETNKKTN